MSTPGSSMPAALLAAEARSSSRPVARASAKLLAEVPLFSGLSRRHLRRLAAVAEEVRFAPGRPIVQEGSRGNAFFVILDGEAKVTMAGATRTAARLGRGDFFGELAVLDGGPRTASVIALTRVVVARITRTQFRKVLRQEPDVALAILEEVSRRLRRQRSVTQ
jgi:CRP/FNR family transcriptional regulator, cyclic AMP receptor protein